MAIETHPHLRQWQWHVGALHQHHYAFAMLMEFHLRPEQEGAERAWECLDWVFEVPASHKDLPGRIKSHQILTEILNGTMQFVASQRVRCPTEIMDTTKLLAYPLRGSESSSEDVGYLKSMFSHMRPSASNSQGPRIGITSPPVQSGLAHASFPQEAMKPLSLADHEREEHQMRPEMQRSWVCRNLHCY